MYKLTKDDRVVLYNKVFGTDEGKIVLENIMEICGVNTVSADLLNPNITYYNEGARAVGIKIKTILNKKEIQNVRVK
jgi:hypothetical protein